MSTAETAEITEDSTPEEIREVVSDLLSATQEDETPAPQPDDEPKDPPPGVEQSAGEEPAAESGEEAAEDDPTDDTKGESAEGADWIDDDVRGLASALEISDEQLSMFTSRDDLERALTLLDSKVMQSGDPPVQQTQEEAEQQEERHAKFSDRRPDGTLLPLRVIRVHATGTTASDIVGLW